MTYTSVLYGFYSLSLKVVLKVWKRGIEKEEDQKNSKNVKSIGKNETDQGNHGKCPEECTAKSPENFESYSF